MEGPLIWMLAAQLAVILLVAISIILFIVKKLAGKARIPAEGAKSILVTAADTPIGMQIARHLAAMKFRVFAGVSDVNSQVAYRLRSNGSPWLHILYLDVTKDDSLNQAVKAVREHSHAGEKGVWAVIHLAGTGQVTPCKLQGGDDEHQLRTALEVTVVGMLRLVRVFLPSLSAAAGRLIILGADDGMSHGLRVWGGGVVGVTHGVWTAARFAAEGLAAGLRAQLKSQSISVISLHPDAYYAHRINEFPVSTSQKKKDSWGITVSEDAGQIPLEVEAQSYERLLEILSPHAMGAVDEAILSSKPNETYVLSQSTGSRIKNMLMAISPTCVTTNIIKHEQLQYG